MSHSKGIPVLQKCWPGLKQPAIVGGEKRESKRREQESGKGGRSEIATSFCKNDRKR